MKLEYQEYLLWPFTVLVVLTGAFFEFIWTTATDTIIYGVATIQLGSFLVIWSIAKLKGKIE